MRTTMTCLIGGVLLLVSVLLPVRAAPVMAADPAVWGVYAELLGRTWEAPGKYSVTVNWAVPGEIITETWISPTTRSVQGTVTLTRGERPGELVAKSSPIPMKWTGRFSDADTIVFERGFIPKLPYRIRLGAEGFEHQRVKLADGSVVEVTSSDHYVAVGMPGAEPEAPTAATPAPVPAGAAAPAGAHPVRVVGGTEAITGAFKDGISGIDDNGARYDCYLIDTRPGDRWEVEVEADDTSLPDVIAGYFRSVDGADCGASRDLAAVKRKEAWLSYTQTYSMTAGGGYYWFVPVGIPERAYTLRFKRKEGKVDPAAVAGVATLPAPLVATDRGPVTAVLEDADRRRQRVAGVEAVYARLAGRTYRGPDTWSTEREQLSVPFKQYQWAGPGSELHIQGGQVLGSGVQAASGESSYRMDPVAGVFRAEEGGDYVEHFPADDNALLVVGYGRDGAGRRARSSSFVMSLLPDGGQAFDGQPLYTPTTATKLATLVPELQQNEVARRAALAEERRLLAEQQAREAQESAERGNWVGGLVGALAGAAAVASYDGSTEQILGGMMKGAQIGNPNSQMAAALGAQGETLITGTGAGAGATGIGGVGGGGAGSYATRPNLALSACAGFTEANYREKALSGGGDQQLYAMCGQAFEYYTMYKRAIAQGYSEADANRTYAAHQQSAQVASGFLSSHGAN